MSTSTSPVKPATPGVPLPATSPQIHTSVSQSDCKSQAADLPIGVVFDSPPGTSQIRRFMNAFLKGMRTFEIWQSLIATFLLLAGALHSCPSEAADASPEYRLSTAYRSFSNAYQVTAAWKTRVPRWLPRWIRATRAEFGTGVISGSGNARMFASFGPVWRLNDPDHPAVVEFGFSPTLLGGSTLGDQDLGGNLHFTSSLAIGRAFGLRKQYLASMRLQHLSNGGLNNTNPGLDSIGVGFSGRFGNR